MNAKHIMLCTVFPCSLLFAMVAHSENSDRHHSAGQDKSDWTYSNRTSSHKQNFPDIRETLDAFNKRLTELEVDNHDLRLRLSMAEIYINSLTSYISELQSYISVREDNQGNPTIFISGVNVHIDNGEGSTNSINGLGNLIVGYDEAKGGLLNPVCSDGRYDNEFECVNNGGIYAVNHKTGSHNIILGFGNSYSQYGGLLAGTRNTVTGINSTIVGGSENLARGSGVSISGGNRNTAAGGASYIGGGENNLTEGLFSSVTGGINNIASGVNSSVSGGQSNRASGFISSVSGGLFNISSGANSSVSGGRRNISSGLYSSISGGLTRTTTGQDDWVAGSLFEDE